MPVPETNPVYPVGECGILRVMQPLAFMEERETHVLEASGHHLSLRLDTPIASGLSVVVLLSRSALVGIVVTCRQEGLAYKVGILLTMQNPFETFVAGQAAAPPDAGRETADPLEQLRAAIARK